MGSLDLFRIASFPIVGIAVQVHHGHHGYKIGSDSKEHCEREGFGEVVAHITFDERKKKRIKFNSVERVWGGG